MEFECFGLQEARRLEAIAHSMTGEVGKTHISVSKNSYASDMVCLMPIVP